MPSKKYTVVIIGLGNIGLGFDLCHKNKYALTHSKSFMEHGGYKLICGIDINIDRRKEFESFTDKPAYAKLSEIPVLESCDIIVIATPLQERVDLLKQCLSLKPRLILMEKPLASNTKEGQEIIKMCEDAKCELMINYMRRCEPAVQELKKQIQANLFGGFLCGNAYYSRGIYNNASHFFDLCNFLIGPASSWKVLEKNDDNCITKDPGSDFYVSYQGSSCVFQAIDNAEFSIWQLTLVFEKAVLEYGDFGRDITIKKIEQDPHYPDFKHLVHDSKRIESDFQNCQRHVAEHIHQHFTSGIDLISTGQTSLSVLAICEDLAGQCQ